MPKKGGKRKKTRTHAAGDETGAAAPSGAAGDGIKDKDVPRSLVVRASVVAPAIRLLIRDLRKVMSPYTAMNLKERNYNRVKDYTAVATQLGLTHLVAISQTKSNVVARIGRFMNGPTLHFKINQYSLVTQVKQAQKKPFESASVLQTPPIVVLNNFGQSEENTVKLMRTTLQNMFPPINVKTVRLAECRRVVLFHLKKDDGLVEMRHYAIRAQPVGINRNIKKILQSKIPDLSQLRDVSEFLDSQAYGAGAASDSEAEEEYSKVVLPDKFKGTGNDRSQKSAIKLTELGPRVTMELFKVESGLCEGDILFHKFQTKTPEEARKTKERIERQKQLKIQRKAVQDANVKRKREESEAKHAAKQEKKRLRLESGGAADGGSSEDSEEDEEDEEDADEYDDDDDYGDDDGADDDDAEEDDEN